jgi:hypothetical protein
MEDDDDIFERDHDGQGPNDDRQDLDKLLIVGRFIQEG